MYFAILTQIFLVFTVLNVYPGKINSLKCTFFTLACYLPSDKDFVSK